MTDRATLEALLARVEGAEGGDCLLDAWIAASFQDLAHESARWAAHWEGEWIAECGRVHLLNDAGERSFNFAPPEYTSSIDAALAAADAVGVEGWKLVPVEPTEAMIDAGVYASARQSVSAIYRAMAGTAPLPPQEGS